MREQLNEQEMALRIEACEKLNSIDLKETNLAIEMLREALQMMEHLKILEAAEFLQ